MKTNTRRLLLAMSVMAPLSSLTFGAVKPAFFDKQGIKVLAETKGPGGLTAWRVMRNGVQTVFYSTADGKVMLSGVLWDSATGKNLSDTYMVGLPDSRANSSAKPVKPWNGVVPDQIKGIAALTGVKEGNASIEKTLYIMFDPRCTHCHSVYRNTRDYVARGGSIKWLPVTVLGNSSEGASLVAAVLQSKTPSSALASAMMGFRPGRAQPGKSDLQTISENEAYFWAAYRINPAAGSAGVPVAFFMTQDGKPEMLGGIDDPALLPNILNRVWK